VRWDWGLDWDWCWAQNEGGLFAFLEDLWA